MFEYFITMVTPLTFRTEKISLMLPFTIFPFGLHISESVMQFALHYHHGFNKCIFTVFYINERKVTFTSNKIRA